MRRGKAVELLRKSRQAIKAKTKTSDLLTVLQSEIIHELSSPCFQNGHTGSLGDFSLEWDAPHCQDVVLRRKCETGEEVAVSALLGSNYVGNKTYPRNVTMKVCIKKPGLSSLLQFDCGVSYRSYTGPEFDIHSAHYLRSSSSTGLRYYMGPIFRDLDPSLQTAFKEYLKARGVGESLLNFLLLHMHKKEQDQYVKWLLNLQETLSSGE